MEIMRKKMVEMSSVFVAVCIENCIYAICWTALAIHFDKWWIALFMTLCFSTFKNKQSTKKEGTDEK